MGDFKGKLTRGFGKAKFTAIKYSPEILLASGIISGAACVFFACKGTLKASGIVEEHEKMVNDIHEALEIADEGEYTKEDAKKEMVVAYTKTGVSFVKTYAPAIIFGTLSMACILSSHGIMKKRNVALAASLATVRTAFEEYRGRVVRDLGKEMDKHFLYDTVEEVREKEVVTEDGKKKKIKEKVVKAMYANAYSRIFDNCNAPDEFQKDGAANYIFIRSQMLNLQDKLVSRGYLFLNEVYDKLGFPITIAGQSAGWIYDYNNRENTCFAIEGFDVNEINNSQAVRDLMNGYENSIILNFLNIQDNILVDIPRVDSNVAAI